MEGNHTNRNKSEEPQKGNCHKNSRKAKLTYKKQEV